MWTPATRAQHMRVSRRYQTDLSDAEWELIAAFLPKASSTGRRREWLSGKLILARRGDEIFKLQFQLLDQPRRALGALPVQFAFELLGDLCADGWRRG